MFQRYIVIQRYMNIRAKTGNATNALHSNKAHQRQPRAKIIATHLHSTELDISAMIYSVSPYTAKEPFLHHAVISRQSLTK